MLLCFIFANECVNIYGSRDMCMVTRGHFITINIFLGGQLGGQRSSSLTPLAPPMFPLAVDRVTMPPIIKVRRESAVGQCCGLVFGPVFYFKR